MRKTRSDKKINVNPNLPKDTHDKLFKLALSCEMSKTKLAEKIITISVNNPDFINQLQDHYNQDGEFRITPIVVQGNIIY